ncbi:DNA polymerase kappa [Diplonema papillatum]|nr:DNA polymerase kappa [Diplonema papillatum]
MSADDMAWYSAEDDEASLFADSDGFSDHEDHLSAHNDVSTYTNHDAYLDARNDIGTYPSHDAHPSAVNDPCSDTSRAESIPANPKSVATVPHGPVARGTDTTESLVAGQLCPAARGEQTGVHTGPQEPLTAHVPVTRGAVAPQTLVAGQPYPAAATVQPGLRIHSRGDPPGVHTGPHGAPAACGTNAAKPPGAGQPYPTAAAAERGLRHTGANSHHSAAQGRPNVDQRNVAVSGEQPGAKTKSDASTAHLYVFTAEKGGMQGFDKALQQKVIAELSSGSAHLKHAMHLDVKVSRKIEHIKRAVLDKKQQCPLPPPGPLHPADCPLLQAAERDRDLTRWCACVDMDMFFAAVEIKDNPALRNVPMAVGGPSMISTANYVARRYGVRSAMPGFIAAELCRRQGVELVFVGHHTSRYHEEAEAVRAVVSRYGPFSSYSSDEATIDLTERVHDEHARRVDSFRRRRADAAGAAAGGGSGSVQGVQPSAAPRGPGDRAEEARSEEASRSEERGGGRSKEAETSEEQAGTTRRVRETAEPGLSAGPGQLPPGINVEERWARAAASAGGTAETLFAQSGHGSGGANVVPEDCAQRQPAAASAGGTAEALFAQSGHGSRGANVVPEDCAQRQPAAASAGGTAETLFAQSGHGSRDANVVPEDCAQRQPAAASAGGTAETLFAQSGHGSRGANVVAEDCAQRRQPAEKVELTAHKSEDGTTANAAPQMPADSSEGRVVGTTAIATSEGSAGGRLLKSGHGATAPAEQQGPESSADGGQGASGDAAEEPDGEPTEEGTASLVLAAMRREIFEATGLTASGGVAPNFLLAKMGSDVNKPDGQFVVPRNPGWIRAWVGGLPVRKIPGIGKVTERVLKEAIDAGTCGQVVGLRHLLPLVTRDASQLLRSCLGIGRNRLRDESNKPASAVSRQSLSAERTFRPTSDAAKLREKLRAIAKTVAGRLEKENLEGRTVVLRIKKSSFEVLTRQKNLPGYVQSADDLYKHALVLLENEMPAQVRLMGIKVASFKNQISRASAADVSQMRLTTFVQRPKEAAAQSDRECVVLSNEAEPARAEAALPLDRSSRKRKIRQAAGPAAFPNEQPHASAQKSHPDRSKRRATPVDCDESRAVVLSNEAEPARAEAALPKERQIQQAAGPAALPNEQPHASDRSKRRVAPVDCDESRAVVLSNEAEPARAGAALPRERKIQQAAGPAAFPNEQPHASDRSKRRVAPVDCDESRAAASNKPPQAPPPPGRPRQRAAVDCDAACVVLSNEQPPAAARRQPFDRPKQRKPPESDGVCVVLSSESQTPHPDRPKQRKTLDAGGACVALSNEPPLAAARRQPFDRSKQRKVSVDDDDTCVVLSPAVPGRRAKRRKAAEAAGDAAVQMPPLATRTRRGEQQQQQQQRLPSASESIASLLSHTRRDGVARAQPAIKGGGKEVIELD